MRCSTLIVLLGNSAWCAIAAYMPGFEIPSFELQAQYMRVPFSTHALGFLKKREISHVENLPNPTRKLFTRTVDEFEDNEDGDDENDNEENDNSSTLTDGRNDDDSTKYRDGQRDITNLTAGQAWDTHKMIMAEYFTKDPITVTDSRPDLFFHEFMDSYVQNDPFGCRKQQLGQLQCFIKIYTGDLNWNCRVDSPQNCQISKPREVLDHIWSHWPTTSVFTVDKKAEIARKVYFSLLNLRESQTQVASLFNIMEVVADVMRDSASTLVQQFTPQPDRFLSQMCQLQMHYTKLAITEALAWATQQMSRAAEKKGEDGEAAIPVVSDWQDKYESVKKAVQLTNAAWNFWNDHTSINPSGYNITSQGVRKGIWIYNKANEIGLAAQMNSLVPWPNWMGDEAPWRGENRLSMTFGSPQGWCGGVWGVHENNNQDRISELTGFIAEQQKKIRDDLAETFEYMINYDEYAPDNYVLRQVMAFDHFTSRGNFRKSYGEEREEVATAVSNMLISELSASSRCYMECNEVPDAGAKCDRKTKRTWVYWSRYCPDDKTVCQVSCLPKALVHIGHHEKKPLWGGRYLPQYGHTMKDLMESSWANWNATRSITDEGVTLQHIGAMRPEWRNLQLPVCYGPYDTVDSKSQLQFGCGATWRLDDTKPFLERTGILQSNALAGDHELRHMGIPPFLKQVESPISSFLLLCKTNTRWPWGSWQAFKDLGEMCRGTDPRCDLVQDEIQFMKTEFQANHHFCLSKTANSIFRDEVGRLTRPANGPKNLEKKCDGWVLHNKHLFKTKGKNTEKNFRKYIDKRRQDMVEEKGEGYQNWGEFIEELEPGKN